jgi:tetratricopeptide (TPR) repeat protein
VTQPTPFPVTQPTTAPATTAPATTAPATTAPATQPAPVAQVPLPPVKDADLPTDPKVIESDSILADRLGNVAELSFPDKTANPEVWPWIWKHEAALMKAAARLSPRDSRFLRLEADAYAQLHDSKGELEALGGAILADQNRMLTPDDFVWNRDLDLRVADIQNAREKISYLTDIIGTDSVPAYVRAHAARLKAQLQLERGEEESALKTLSEALTKAPLSIECLKLRYAMLPPTATRFERVSQLLDLLRANPLQSQFSAELADLVADAGLVNESLPWFNLAIVTLHQQGDTAAHSMLRLAVALFMSDQVPDALRVNTALLKVDPTNASANFLQVILTRNLHDQNANTKAIIQAANVLNNSIVDVMNAVAPANTPKATTRPVDDTDPLVLPDLQAAVGQLNLSGTPEQKGQFAEAVADLAMLRGYFATHTDDADHLVDILKQVVPANSPELDRLYGWNSFSAGKMDDAKAKFSNVAAQDPLAELGLIEVLRQDGVNADREKAESMARRLIADHPSGLLGAMLWDRLHNDRIKLIPNDQAVAMQTPLAAFPRDLFQLVDQPQSLYGIHVQPAPMRVGSYFGDPLLAEVRIDNIGSVDLTVGPEGVIKPELLFKVLPQTGDKPPSFDAFDSISGPSVLSHATRITQTVRLDQTQMLGFLNSRPGVAFSVNGMLATNEVANRIGGYQVAFAKPFYRMASLTDAASLQATAGIALQGRPDQQITALGQLQLFVIELRSLKTPPEGTDKNIAAMLETLHKARADDLPAVAAWASFCEAQLLPPSQLEAAVRDMVESADWRHRQLAILLLGGLEAPVRDELLNELITDKQGPQGSVRDEAIAMQGLLAFPAPATQPTTAPTLAPPADTATPGLTPILPTTPPANP